MDIEERAKWLKWRKLGLRVPLQSEETAADNKEINLEKTLESILKRQEDMETNFNNFLRTTRIQSGDSGTSYSKQPKLEKSERSTKIRQYSDQSDITRRRNKSKVFSKWLRF